MIAGPVPARESRQALGRVNPRQRWRLVRGWQGRRRGRAAPPPGSDFPAGTWLFAVLRLDAVLQPSSRSACSRKLSSTHTAAAWLPVARRLPVLRETRGLSGNRAGYQRRTRGYLLRTAPRYAAAAVSGLGSDRTAGRYAIILLGLTVLLTCASALPRAAPLRANMSCARSNPGSGGDLA